MKIAILGGDGFCGWPTSLYLSAQGHDVHIIDNLSRRWIDSELGVQSLTPIATIQRRIEAWREVSGKDMGFTFMDLAKDYGGLKSWLLAEKPDAIVHFAEQRAAPYSMKSDEHKRYTVNNNIGATHNLLAAITETGLDIHVVHLGTMGVYGYSTVGAAIPEGYLDVQIELQDGSPAAQSILYPTNPGSVYHMTKSLDQILFQFYAKNDKLRVTDLHQGIVWGVQTEQTALHPDLVNRFDYDGDYGTVLNRLLIQAAVGHPLTVHGTGGQTRAFIHIQDTARCVAAAIENPPSKGERVEIFNQMTETHRVRDLAALVSKLTGAEVRKVPNPRLEADENELVVNNQKFKDLGLDLISLGEGLLEDIIEISGKYADRIDKSRIPAASAWTKQIKDTLPGA